MRNNDTHVTKRELNMEIDRYFRRRRKKKIDGLCKDDMSKKGVSMEGTSNREK